MEVVNVIDWFFCIILEDGCIGKKKKTTHRVRVINSSFPFVKFKSSLKDNRIQSMCAMLGCYNMC